MEQTDDYCMLLCSQEAIEYVMNELGYSSYYSIAKALSEKDVITVQTTQVINYRKGKRAMSKKVAEQFYLTFGIEIADIHIPKGRPQAW